MSLRAISDQVKPPLTVPIIMPAGESTPALVPPLKAAPRRPPTAQAVVPFCTATPVKAKSTKLPTVAVRDGGSCGTLFCRAEKRARGSTGYEAVSRAGKQQSCVWDPAATGRAVHCL